MRDTLSLCLPLFYSSRRETVCHPFTSHLFFVLSDRDTPRFSPTKYGYLGLDLCTYLFTIQQKARPRVRAGSHTLYTVCAWGRFSSRQRPLVCAKKREGEISATVVNQIPPYLHLHPPYYVHRRGDRDQDPRLVFS